MNIKYGSVCSGIEAATVAWHPLGWKASWFAEFENFPSRVLAHHYPDVINLGDMTKIPEMVMKSEIEVPEILVGGTPCQAFSIAGLRNSLDDDRGQLSLAFVRIANEIDTTRLVRGLKPAVIVWENVPGVLTTDDNAFGCFLSALCGEDSELYPEPRPENGKSSRFWKWSKERLTHKPSWPHSGYVFGPQRQVAWRVLNAQYFGLPQRRKRVFVVASARKRCIAEILIESKSVSGDSEQGRGKGENIARDGETSIGKSVFGLSPRVLSLDISNKLMGCLTATDYKQPKVVFIGTVADACRDISKNIAPTLRVGTKQNGAIRQAVFGIQGNIIGRAIGNGGNGLGFKEEQAPTLTACDRHGVIYSFDSLASNSMKSSNPHSGCRRVEISKTLDTSVPCPSKNQGGILVIDEKAYSMIADTTPKISLEINGTLRSSGGGGIVPSSVTYQQVARYITEIECERLQGFSDNYTNIPNATKGNRYKAIGNSMAVPVMRWIGERIEKYLESDV